MGVFGASFVVRIGAYGGGDRPYRTALDTAQACGEIADGSGSQFCPDTAEAFLEIMRTENRE